MADSEENTNEKEFEATESKRNQSREEGSVAQSKEVNAFAMLAGVVVASIYYQHYLSDYLSNHFSQILIHMMDFQYSLTASHNRTILRDWNMALVMRLMPLFIIPICFVLTSLNIQRSVTFSPKKLKPDLKKISPMDNFKKKYGKQGMTDFAKDLVKLLIASIIAVYILYKFMFHDYASSAINPQQFTTFIYSRVMEVLLLFLLFYFFLSAVDFPLQYYLHEQKMRMTREEMKKEQKQNEGDPHLKQSRRQKGMDITSGRMLLEVPKATVVIVNPEHYAVALTWDPHSGSPPVCVAKGVDFLAAKIRAIAKEHSVPIYSDPPTARSMYKMVDIGEPIKREHFAAIAAAINFVNSVAAGGLADDE